MKFMRDAFDPITAQAEAEERSFLDDQRRQRTQLLLERFASSKEGRELLAGLLDLTGLHASSFSTNALGMAYREGRRSVGINLVSIMKPEHYQLMLKERNERRKQRGGSGGNGSSDN
ncbi:Bbp19 family protein [Sutterella wadsworthensis]|mgnify:FL=1|uniref:Bbp19 family protein n=1 Tax=Sutterella wadsworthensis TaxID=40545 RepID=UPI00402ABE1B